MSRFCLLFGVLLLWGCAASMSYDYAGARVDPQSILPLPAVTSEGLHWQDLYLRIDYGLRRQGEQLTIVGQLAFAGYPKMNLVRFRDLTLNLFLVDSQGVVRQSFRLARPLGYDLEEVFPFRQQIALAPEVTGMAFGYEGELVNEEGGIEWFWKRPKR